MNPNQEDATTPEHFMWWVEAIEDLHGENGEPPSLVESLQILAAQQAAGHHTYLYSQAFQAWIDMRHFMNSALLAHHLGPDAAFALGVLCEYGQGFPFMNADNSASAHGAEDIFSNYCGIQFYLQASPNGYLSNQLQTSDLWKQLQLVDPKSAPSYQYLPRTEEEWQAWHQRVHDMTHLPPATLGTQDGAMIGPPTPVGAPQQDPVPWYLEAAFFIVTEAMEHAPKFLPQPLGF